MSKTFECVFVHETDLACCVDIPSLETRVWVPFSQIEKRVGKQIDFHYIGPGRITVSDWFVEKEGLE